MYTHNMSKLSELKMQNTSYVHKETHITLSDICATKSTPHGTIKESFIARVIQDNRHSDMIYP